MTYTSIVNTFNFYTPLRSNPGSATDNAILYIIKCFRFKRGKHVNNLETWRIYIQTNNKQIIFCNDLNESLFYECIMLACWYEK